VKNNKIGCKAKEWSVYLIKCILHCINHKPKPGADNIHNMSNSDDYSDKPSSNGYKSISNQNLKYIPLLSKLLLTLSLCDDHNFNLEIPVVYIIANLLGDFLFTINELKFTNSNFDSRVFSLLNKTNDLPPSKSITANPTETIKKDSFHKHIELPTIPEQNINNNNNNNNNNTYDISFTKDEFEEDDKKFQAQEKYSISEHYCLPYDNKKTITNSSSSSSSSAAIGFAPGDIVDGLYIMPNGSQRWFPGVIQSGKFLIYTLFY
jgi:hypothetical protein